MRPSILSAALLGTIALVPHQQSALAQGVNLDTAAIEQATGLKGQLIPEESVFKVAKPRTDVKIAVDQWKMPPFMGLGSWAASTPAHGGAMLMGDTVVFEVDGDFAMLENEYQPVLRAMRKEGINIIAIHQRMSHEQPRYLFLHYWGKDKAGDLAQSLKRVLDAQAVVKS